MLGGHHSISRGGGGVEFLSRANYLFQPSSAARWKFQIVLHVYIEQLYLFIYYLFHTQSSPEIIYLKKTSPPILLEIEWCPPLSSNTFLVTLWFFILCHTSLFVLIKANMFLVIFNVGNLVECSRSSITPSLPPSDSLFCKHTLCFRHQQQESCNVTSYKPED